jgi:hypothetical protein
MISTLRFKQFMQAAVGRFEVLAPSRVKIRENVSSPSDNGECSVDYDIIILSI